MDKIGNRENYLKNALTLAFLGDSVFTLMVRSYLVGSCSQKPNGLNKRANSVVCAKSQAEIMEKLKNSVLIRNKRASFDYELVDFYKAGIVLVGTEIKSIRLGKASLVDTFCFFNNGELWVKNMNISEYFYGTYNNHLPRRDRKLLLSKKELLKIRRQTKDTGFTVVPTKLFINEKGLAKLEIAVAKGKKSYDKRDALKEKDDKRNMDRAMKR